MQLLGDVDRLQQVLINILSNAIKFVPTGTGEIVIKARTYYWNNGGLSFTPKLYLEVEVADNGPGISESDQKKLFKAYSKVGTNN